MLWDDTKFPGFRGEPKRLIGATALMLVFAWVTPRAGGSEVAKDGVADPGAQKAEPTKRVNVDKVIESLNKPTGDRWAARTGREDAVSPEDAAGIAAVIREGQAAYDQFRKEVELGEYEKLAPRLLDNGKPLDAKKWKTPGMAEQYTKSLDIEKELFAGMKNLKIEPSDFRVERQLIFSQAGPMKEGGAGMTKSETISLVYVLGGTADFRAASFPKVQGRHTLGDDGSLLVVMKRVDGVWYWNPFGW